MTKEEVSTQKSLHFNLPPPFPPPSPTSSMLLIDFRFFTYGISKDTKFNWKSLMRRYIYVGNALW